MEKEVGITVKLKESEKNDFKAACKHMGTDMSKYLALQAKRAVLNHKRNQGSK